jgi:DNA-binding LacI/PurR family transcriptional regulator
MTNAAARALKTNRTYNLGVLLVDEWRSGLSHEYFASLLESFKNEAEKRGYDITFINKNIGGRPTSYLSHCQYRGLDGVIIACIDFTDDRIRELVDGPIPVVTIDHVFENRVAVVSNNASGVAELVRYAYNKGHRKIAFLHGEKITVTQRRLEGFHRACGELGLEIPPEYIRESVYHDTDRCFAETEKLLDLPDPPTCIIFPDDFSYIGGWHAIRGRGLMIPDDISTLGYDGIQLARSMKLTTYSQNTAELGRVAVEKLVGLIEHPKTVPIERIVIPGELLEGNTVKEI